MRTINSIKSISTGFLGQFLTISLQFISRTVFIHILGKEYLGISGLFTNVLHVLNMTELGIGTAIVYSLYKPLAENDKNKVSANLNFLKKSYFIIGCTIAGVGLLLIPFLPYIMKEITYQVNINVIYILYLFQSVASYWFFAYKGALLQADQKKYMANLIRYFVAVITVFIQIGTLVLFKSFMAYTIIGIASQVCVNIITARKVDKLYPYIKSNKNESLSKLEQKQIFKNIYGLSMYKINSTIVRSSDNIVISSFISTIAVGLYSNYHMIVGALLTMNKMIITSFTASVGNLYVTESKEKSVFVFRCLSFLSFWLYGFCSICLWILINPFISLWVGKDYLFNDFTVFVIVLDFLMDGYQRVPILYKDACGLFWQGRYRPFATTILNILLSIALAPSIGIAGVLLGTIISRLFTTWWFEPWLIYKYAFNSSCIKYFYKYISFFLLVIVTAAIVQVLCTPFTSVNWMSFIIRGLLSCLVPNLTFFLVYRNTEEFKYLVGAIKRMIIPLLRKLV